MEEKDLSRLFWILFQLRYICLLVYEGNLKYVRNLMGVYMFIITGTIFCSQRKKEKKRVCACTCMDFHGVCELCNNTRKKVLKTLYKSKFFNKFYIWKLLRNENMIAVHCFLNTKAQFSIPSSLDLAVCERECVCVCACVCCFVSTNVMCIAQYSCSSCLGLSSAEVEGLHHPPSLS